MPKVILLVNVELQPDKREEYLSTTKVLREHLKELDDIGYAVYENQGKVKDSFTEMFTFKDEAAYETFEDSDDEKANDLFAKILTITTRSPKYTTLVGVD